MTRQIVRTAALGTAVLLAGAASVAFGAEPFPNPSMIHRYVGSDTNETWQGVVNNGVVWKRGGGTVTMPAPALNGGGRLNVTAGDVVLDLDAAPTVPTLPDYIVNKIVRGCTLYECKGGYKGDKRVEVQALLTKDEFADLMGFLRNNEIPAFITAGNVSEVYGLWFDHKKRHN